MLYGLLYGLLYDCYMIVIWLLYGSYLDSGAKCTKPSWAFMGLSPLGLFWGSPRVRLSSPGPLLGSPRAFLGLSGYSPPSHTFFLGAQAPRATSSQKIKGWSLTPKFHSPAAQLSSSVCSEHMYACVHVSIQILWPTLNNLRDTAFQSNVGTCVSIPILIYAWRCNQCLCESQDIYSKVTDQPRQCWSWGPSCL